MCALPTLLPCPLCAHPHFDRVESLRDKLIFVSTHTLTCPVCQEEMSGLDKLTIHLFSHVKMKENKVPLDSDQSEISTPKCDSKATLDKPQVYKRLRTQPTKNKPITSAKAPVKFVKIFPKLPVISLNTMPIIEISQNRLGDNLNNPFCLSSVSANLNNAIVSRIETANADVQYGCEFCGLSFTDEQILKMHKALIHNINEESSLILEKFPCHLCNKHFKMKGSLMVHLRVAHYGTSSNVVKDATTTNCTNTLLESTNTSEMKQSEKLFVPEKSENKQWFCEVCEKSFTTKYFLKKHKRLHTGETPYACVQCNKTFTFQQSYHKHLLYHNDEKPHSCTFCGRSFKELSTLHNHQRIHTGEKPFSCETCGKCFRQRVSYLVHRRIHTGVMPYKCTACNKSFRYKVSQRTHKCPAQPPGTVVRQSGELLEKLKKKYNENDSISTNSIEHHPDNIYSNISEANAELIRTGAKLSFEDTEADNFTLIYKSPIPADHVNHIVNEVFDIIEPPNLISHHALSHNSNENKFDDLINSHKADKSIPSPSEILKNLCLSNYDEDCQNSKNIQSNTSEITVNELNLDVIYNEFNQFL